jgi:ribosome-binding factor A
LTLAKIYLSLFNTEEKAAILLLLQEELVKLRQGLGARIRKVVRIIPHIELHLDDTLDEMYRIDALMQRVHEADKLGKE